LSTTLDGSPASRLDRTTVYHLFWGAEGRHLRPVRHNSLKRRCATWDCKTCRRSQNAARNRSTPAESECASVRMDAHPRTTPPGPSIANAAPHAIRGWLLLASRLLFRMGSLLALRRWGRKSEEGQTIPASAGNRNRAERVADPFASTSTRSAYVLSE
jgi:hypothetical protein